MKLRKLDRVGATQGVGVVLAYAEGYTKLLLVFVGRYEYALSWGKGDDYDWDLQSEL